MAGPDNVQAKASQKRLRVLALNALARREHSRDELAKKLQEKYPEGQEFIEAVLAQLVLDDLQSDQRFSEAYSRSVIQRGYGRRYLTQQLRQKGIDAELINTVLTSMAVDWYRLAVKALHKKFGSQHSSDFKEQVKQQRFLNYRGFSSEQIRHALGFDITDL